MSKEARQLSERDAAILEIVEAATIARPITIRSIQLWLINKGFRRPDDRTVKGVIAELRLAGHPIGASRGKRDDSGNLTEAPGYYYARTEEERRKAMLAYWRQIKTSIELARVFSKGLKEDVQLQAMEQLSLIEI
jgi:hypothetical protein